ncbi:MAG: class I SAM-dependent methyltransferase [Terracidiphilus sp.]
MHRVEIPEDLNGVLAEAWAAARGVPGFLLEAEARFLGMAAACTPGKGAIVEIGSFKGKSTVMVARVARHYGLGLVVAIDPHTFNNPELEAHRTTPEASSFEEFLSNLARAGVADQVDVRRDFSANEMRGWSAPIRLLWIDGDHSWHGAKADFDGFLPHVIPGGVVVLHDALHAFAGPIRVFVEQMLRSASFGAAGFVGSIAWSQFRPEDGAAFAAQRARVERQAARLIPYTADDGRLHGLKKLAYKLNRSRVRRAALPPAEWAARMDGAR